MGSSEGLGASLKASSQVPPKQYVVTKPISMAGPTVSDLKRSRELKKVRLLHSFSLSCALLFFPFSMDY